MGTIDESRPLIDSSNVFRKFGNILMIAAALSAMGTHWLALQSVAWTAMLAENLHTTSWEHAIKCTFDGKHPCCLCREIARARQSEKKSDVSLELRKLDYSHTSFEFVFCAPTDFYEMRDPNDAATSLKRAPAVPPPKQFPG